MFYHLALTLLAYLNLPEWMQETASIIALITGVICGQEVAGKILGQEPNQL